MISFGYYTIPTNLSKTPRRHDPLPTLTVASASSLSNLALFPPYSRLTTPLANAIAERIYLVSPI